MRLTFKLMAGSLIGIALLLGANVVARGQREASALRGEIRRDHLVLSRALRIDIVHEWEIGGQVAANHLVQRLNAERAGVDLSIWSTTQLPSDVAFDLHDGRELQRVEDREANPVLVTWSPIVVDGRMIGSLRIDEPFAPVPYTVNIAERVAGGALIALLVATVLAWSMGFFVNGDPMQLLVDKARRVARGDLAGDIAVTRSDELFGRLQGKEFGVLAVELNAMSHSLASAQRAVQLEAENQLRAVNNLRHAERLSTVGTLAAGIAHELGTPLNVVLGRTQMIGDAKTVDDAVRQAKVIDEQTRKVIRIVRQLLDFARAETPNRADVDLNGLARSTCELLKTIADDRSVVLRVADPVTGARPIIANIDAGQVQQALTNLLVNAIHATAKFSEVVVHVRSHVTPQPESKLLLGETPELSAPPIFACFDVEDEGPGISAELKDKVFTPFFTTKPAGEGTGLGLAVAWGIVKENGGAIEIHAKATTSSSSSQPSLLSSALSSASAPGPGAVFRMLLPEVT